MSPWVSYDANQLAELNKLCENYCSFISANKSERECARTIVEQAKLQGFRDVDELVKHKTALGAGDKVYAINRGKAVVLITLGELPLSEGCNILASHIDSPRLDVKQNPLDEKDGLAYLDTHYYGGIKKYQWLTIPLAIHGVVACKDGTTHDICIGEDNNDPVFVVSDLLPHLAADQMSKKANEFVEGEMLDVVIGNRPLQQDAASSDAKTTDKPSATDSMKDAVKAQVLAILEQTYGITEDDFMSAELEIVPAGPARDCGFDRSMILGYGHDDRACAYTNFLAQLNCEAPKRSAITILADKEEVGSIGATGMASRFFEDVMAEVLELAGETDSLALRRCLRRSRLLSSDVSAAYDPMFPQAFEAKNSAYLGKGIAFNKYTGSRGKSGSNDSDAEYVAWIRRLLDEANLSYQNAELGKVDQGGGGTIAYILAKYGMDAIDCGLAVLSMHAPWEVISKADLFEAYRFYCAFLASR